MADAGRRLTTNVEGDLFVDDSCIDCGACRWMAPATFDRSGDASRVHRQPRQERELRRALQAVVACPTGSIGTTSRKSLVAEAAASFPHPMTDDVYHCGFHDERSYGAASYLLVRDGGNVLVDVPRFHRGLVRRIEELGGVDTLFLTHKDDVAGHARFSEHFGCTRIMHEADRTTGTADIERWLTGNASSPLADDLLMIPTPGHTRGSACLLFDERVLFGGDHVAFHLGDQRVYAFSGACWYDWPTQIRSMEKLFDFRFEHILPGHGAPCHFSADAMRQQVRQCVGWMRTAR
jgi:glyoxylase-like metal-dependent hydrolase (beta-lactamase superfamily II)/ferredoxin